MLKIQYGLSMIVKDSIENIVGVHAINLIVPDNMKNISEIVYKFVDIYDKHNLAKLPNIEIKDNKINTIHGALKNYNKITMNVFGHVLPQVSNFIVCVCKIGDKYLCVDVNDCIRLFSLKDMLNLAYNRLEVSNLAISHNGIRPLASMGHTHKLPEYTFDVKTNVLEDAKNLNEQMRRWLLNKGNKAILLDIDGTITDKNGAIPKEIIHRLQTLNRIDNMYVILSTGRVLEREISKDIKSRMVSLGNGSVIIWDDKVVYNKVLDTNICLKVSDYAEKMGYACQVYDVEDRVIIRRINTYQHEDPELLNPNNSYREVRKIEKEHCLKTPKLLISVSPDKTNEVKEAVEKLVNKNIANVLITTKTTVEVVSKGIDKKFALQSICKFLNTSVENTIAVGDGNNDIPMLESAGMSFAVENGTPQVKQCVTKVLTKSMWEGTLELLTILMRGYYLNNKLEQVS